MNAADSEVGSFPPDESRTRTAKLAESLRTIASEATQIAQGPVLIFAAAPGDATMEGASRLRAAAGMSTARAGRDTADLLLPHVREVLESETTLNLGVFPALGETAAGGVVIHPLSFEGRVHGALAAACSEGLSPERFQTLAELAGRLSLRLDHAHLEKRLVDAQERLVERPEDDRADEILKLSEALFAQDIELLRSNEKLGKVEKLKNDFIEKMSRELRTPLNSIIEGIIAVLTGESEAISAEAKTTLRSALDEGTAFLRTLQNILDLWRIKQGELPVEIQDVNFREMVDEAIFSIQDGVGDKPLSIEPRFPIRSPSSGRISPS